MRAVIQRVSSARVVVDGFPIGSIRHGFVVLLGIKVGDGIDHARWLADKVVGLRILADADGKMNRSIQEAGGSILVVSQFTLYADCEKGRRPSFIEAARPEVAEPLYQSFIDFVRGHGVPVATGRFGADMRVELTNDGPVTLIVDTMT